MTDKKTSCLRLSNVLEQHFETAITTPDGLAKQGLISYFLKEGFGITSS